MKKATIITLLGILCLSLCGCNTLATYRDYLATKSGFEKLDKMNAKIAVVQKEDDSKLAAALADRDAKSDAMIKQLTANFQSSSNWIYATYTASQLVQNPQRLDDIIGLRAKSALSYSLSPTVDFIQSQNVDLKAQLDEQVTSKQQLQAAYNKVAQDGDTQKAALIKVQGDLAAASTTLTQVKLDDAKAIGDLKDQKLTIEDKINKVNTDLIARIDDLNAEKKRIIWVLMALGVLFGLGAAYGPVTFKLDSLVGVVGSIGLAILTAYIQPWMIFTAFGVLVAILGVRYYYLHHKTSVLLNGVTGTIGEIKNDAADVYAKIEPVLKDWTADIPGAAAAIEAKLKALNLT